MKKIAAWLLCLVWMTVIFWFSAMPGEVSSEQSGTIVQLLLTLLSAIGVNTAALDLSLLSLLVRKAAHMTEYAVLFFLLRRALRLSGVRHPGLAALPLCVLYGVRAFDTSTISRVCKVPYTAAQRRSDRFKDFCKKRKLESILELQVYEQFRQFIDSSK